MKARRKGLSNIPFHHYPPIVCGIEGAKLFEKAMAEYAKDKVIIIPKNVAVVTAYRRNYEMYKKEHSRPNEKYIWVRSSESMCGYRFDRVEYIHGYKDIKDLLTIQRIMEYRARTVDDAQVRLKQNIEQMKKGKSGSLTCTDK